LNIAKDLTQSLGYSLTTDALVEAGENGAWSAYEKLADMGYS